MSTQTLRMAEVSIQSQRLESAMKRYLPWVALLLLFGLLFFCPDALAQSTTSDPGAQVTRFFDKIILALRPISIAIVTIAFIFAGVGGPGSASDRPAWRGCGVTPCAFTL